MTWTLDTAHTNISFSAKHLGVATVRGRFGGFTADLDLDDPDDPTTGRGRIVIEASSVDTGNEQRDNHLRNADFLDVEHYPTITFEVKKVIRNADGTHRVVGELTIHGVTKEVTFDYEHNGSVTDPFGNVKVGGTITGTINRSDWDLKWNVPLGGGGLLVGDKVRIEVDGELAQVKEAVPAGAEAAV